MKLDKYTYMNRQASDTQVGTRLLINGKIEDGNRIVKLSGYDTVVNSRAKMGGGSIQFDKVFQFKDPRHGYATQKTYFAVWSNVLYWWDGVEWMEVDWNGQEPCNFDEIRFWFERGELHISGGAEGNGAVYQYLDRDPGEERGYFENSKGYVGFWFGREELPIFDNTRPQGVGSTMFGAQIGNATYDGPINTAKCLNPGMVHYVLGIFIFEGGQPGIPNKKGMFAKVMPSGAQDSVYLDIFIQLDPNVLDERVVGIDIYGTSSHKIEYEYKHPTGLPKIANQAISIPVVVRDDTGEQEFETLDFKFLKRIDINAPLIIYEGVMEAADTNTLTYPATIGSEGFFPLSAFSLGYFYVRYKEDADDDWNYAYISSTSNNGTTQSINVSTTPFTGSTKYIGQIVSRWTDVADIKHIDFLWRYDGYGDLDELGDPLDTIQPYSLVKEYHVEGRFIVKQNRRIGKLDCFTDQRYQNMFIWSEADMPSICPNRNLLLLDTFPGEEAKGLCVVPYGWLPLFETSCHLIRVTGEPVTYDAEEGKWNDGCIASRSVVQIEETPLWCGVDGIKMFDGSPKDLTREVLRDAYKDLIASEYAGNNNSYEGIVGAFSRKQNLIVWTFPNSTLTIGDLTVQLLAYDPGKGFFFLESDKTFTWLFEGYDGELYGVDADGVYELFADTPTELNRLVWQSGILMTEMGEVFVERLRAVYKGTPTLSFFADRSATEVFGEALTASTSVAQENRFAMAMGKDMQVQVESESSILDQEIDQIDITVKELALV